MEATTLSTDQASNPVDLETMSAEVQEDFVAAYDEWGPGVARRIKDRLERGALDGNQYGHTSGGGEGCLFCAVVEELFDSDPNTGEHNKQAFEFSLGTENDSIPGGHAEAWLIGRITPGHTPDNNDEARALHALTTRWLDSQTEGDQ